MDHDATRTAVVTGAGQCERAKSRHQRAHVRPPNAGVGEGPEPGADATGKEGTRYVQGVEPAQDPGAEG
jgi:hypothetical protein